MDEMKMDREMQEMLHQCAQGLEASDKLKTRIDFALKSGEAPRKVRRPFAKRLAAVALVAAVAITGAVAANGIVAFTFGSSWSNERMSYEETQAALTDGAKMPETRSMMRAPMLSFAGPLFAPSMALPSSSTVPPPARCDTPRNAS